MLPQITIPPSIGTPENVTTIIVDTSALPQERANLNKEILKSNVILLVYSDNYSYERIALFWLPHYRSLAVKVPVVLCANKSDLSASMSTEQVVEDEMLPVMAEFEEVDSCIRTSAREHHNINEVFFLCQKAVTDPIALLYDSKQSALKPACTSALKRIFHLCDQDQDGNLSDQEVYSFQKKCFGKELGSSDLQNVKDAISKYSASAVNPKGITSEGFLLLNKMYASKGRHETIWVILRTFHYTNSLSLHSSFLKPKLEIPQNTSVELSPAGYRFLIDLFLLHDQENDGSLSPVELNSLFAPTPGVPTSWSADSAESFPSSTVRNEANHITLQGWLAQWSMTTYFSPNTTLAYLAYLGYEDPNCTTTSALHVTKPRKRNTRRGKKVANTERNVLFAYVLGAPGSGKSALLDMFLNRPFTSTYHPTIKPRTAVNSVELPGGKQCTLILEELGELEPAILENPARLHTADLVLYTYSSSDPESFEYIPQLQTQHTNLSEMPALYVALKADTERTTQRGDVQPEEYTTELCLAKPMHVSVTWGSISELFVQVAETALSPGGALPKGEHGEGAEVDWMRWGVVGGAALVVCTATLGIWRRLSKD